jgi:hypothetical protein
MIINTEILVSCGGFKSIYTPCYENSDEKETEALTGTTGQVIKQQMKWLGLFMKFLGTLKYTLGVMF